MNKFLLALSLAWCCVSGLMAQDFEGYVKYDIDIETEDEFFKNILRRGIGTEKTFYYKNGKYKTIVNGQSVSESLYFPEENKLYKFLPDKQEYKVIDCGDTKGTGKILHKEIRDGGIAVLGHDCQMLHLQLDLQEVEYYFNDVTKLDPAFFRGHKHEYWDVVTTETRAIPLKIVTKMSDGTLVTFIATEIKAEKVDDSVFELKQNIPQEEATTSGE